ASPVAAAPLGVIRTCGLAVTVEVTVWVGRGEAGTVVVTSTWLGVGVLPGLGVALLPLPPLPLPPLPLPFPFPLPLSPFPLSPSPLASVGEGEAGPVGSSVGPGSSSGPPPSVTVIGMSGTFSGGRHTVRYGEAAELSAVDACTRKPSTRACLPSMRFLTVSVYLPYGRSLITGNVSRSRGSAATGQ